MPHWNQDQILFMGKVAGGIVSAVGLVVVVFTYRRNEMWKRAEFLAREMKEFLGAPRVQKALVLIDWGERRFDLLEGNPPGGTSVAVTRAMQVRALLPHSLLTSDTADPGMTVSEDWASEGNTASKEGFKQPEVAIRDCYDAFLDGLERFASYVKTGLISASSLRPYIGYWIDDIASPTKNPDDAAWCATLVTYINFYRFDGVLRLFNEFGKDISPDSSIYQEFLSRMADKELALQLAGTLKRTKRESRASNSHP
jgi:hypothetical protein